MVDVDELKRLINEEEQANGEPSSKRKSRLHNSKKDNKLVEKFIEAFGLQPGERRLPNYLIYYNFHVWLKEIKNSKKKPSKIEFFRTFNKHFTQKRTGRQRYYMVNERLDESKEAYEQAKKMYKKKSKKRKTVSGFREKL